MAGHEIDRLRGHLVRRHDQIALVLAILVIDDNDLLPAADALDRFFNGQETVFCSVSHRISESRQ